MPAAARVGDPHDCPKLGPGPTPHLGGPLLPEGEPTVIIGHMPAAREGDHALCAGVFDKSDAVAKGSATVWIGGQPAARLGDPLQHAGHVQAGCPTVLIGDETHGASLAAASGGFAEICEPGPPDNTV